MSSDRHECAVVGRSPRVRGKTDLALVVPQERRNRVPSMPEQRLRVARHRRRRRNVVVRAACLHEALEPAITYRREGAQLFAHPSHNPDTAHHTSTTAARSHADYHSPSLGVRVRLVRVSDRTFLPREVRGQRAIVLQPRDNCSPYFLHVLGLVCRLNCLQPPTFLGMFAEVAGRAMVAFVEEPFDGFLQLAVFGETLEAMVAPALLVPNGDVLGVEGVHRHIPILSQLL